METSPLSLWERFEPAGTSYELIRNLFLRFLGFIYFVAYLSLNRQVLALLGQHGLLPASLFLNNVHDSLGGSTLHCFLRLPSFFWINCDDRWLWAGSCLGLLLSVMIMAGITNAAVMTLQWFLYMSFVHIGQVFYGYGWETMTLEAGFLAIFLCPLAGIRPGPSRYPTPKVILWFYRWMLFRVMFGAGMIKIRGDECWRDLTCLVYHYETQPIPGPLSWYLHHMPLWFHQAGCLFNHFVELFVPWFYFAPRRARHVAGVLTIVFQTILILSGNLSFLNWLTIAITIPCFDDRAIRWLLSQWPGARKRENAPQPQSVTSPARRIVLTGLSALLILLSIDPARNLLSSRQLMNASFNQLHLVNTYGAFGTVGRVRDEIIIEGTYDKIPDDSAHWQAYEFLAKPGDPMRMPAWIAPYQSRIDWQIWFAAMEEPTQNPWLIHLIDKLLRGDEPCIALLKTNPFTKGPPLFIRADLYEYHFTTGRKSGAWWVRKKIGPYVPPLSMDNSELQRFLDAYGWSD